MDRTDDVEEQAGNATDDTETTVDSVSPAELARLLRTNDPITVLDVRDRDEIEQWRIEGESVRFTQIPHTKFLASEVSGTIDELAAKIEGDEPILAVCARGEESAHTVRLLDEAGVEAHNLAGGMNAWAHVYESQVIETDVPVTIHQYRRPSSGCLSYLLVSDGEAAIIDPLRAFTDQYVADVKEQDAEIEYAIDTHIHADHVSGVRAFATRGVTPILPNPAAAREVEYSVTTVDDGDTIAIGETTLETVAAPGHTPGTFVFTLGKTVFTGDALFVDGVPRPDLAVNDSDVSRMAATLHETLTERFEQFDDDTSIAPGHYQSATTPDNDGLCTASLGDLRQHLRVFAMDQDAFVAAVQTEMGPRPANHERITDINRGRADASPEEVFSLELGPNNCAATFSEDR
jgi:glyoxylase-like metal-dependent hydrolase (beta-lactamase superfamily II)/rhodanese-related sulfurtransferase